MTPRILYVTPHQPDRATGASEIRSRSIARALADLGRVECIVVRDPEDAASMAAQVPVPVPVRDSVSVSRHPNSTLSSKLRWLAEPRFEYPHGCGVSKRDLQRVRRTAREFDIVWFCKLRTANMFPCWSWNRSVVDIDDVPSAYEQSLLNASAATVDRLSSRLRAISWQRRERLLGDRFTVLAVCSELDRRYLQLLGIDKALHVIPNGVDAPATLPVRRLTAAAPRLGFIGIYDYEPNRLGIEWFVSDCWPRIKHAVPDTRLRLVGRGTEDTRWLGAGIDGLGWLGDPGDEMATWSATIVPIQVGAGTRGKIAYAFSTKCPVVSTSLGAHGYDVRDGEGLLIADSADSFADACVRLLRDRSFGDSIAERAWQRFVTTWTWAAIQPRIQAAAEECIRLSDRQQNLDESAVDIRVWR
jgi:glycosyltransferase involved in cell wall biosynthesis